MAENTISRVYRTNESHFTRHLREAKSLDEQRLHKVRVDIKNMRIMLGLLRVVTGKKKSGQALMKQLDPVFRKAGKIRTASLNLTLSQPYRSQVLLKFKQHLRLEQQQARHEFLHTLRKFSFRDFKKANKKVAEEFSGLKSKKVKRSAEEYMRVMLAHVRSEVFDISDDETLHQIRKRLKTIRNVGQLLLQMDPEFALKDELQKISLTYDKIGQWHDTQELIDAIEHYLEELDDPIALEKTAPLIIALKKRCIYSKRQIERKLKVDLVLKEPIPLEM